MIAATVYATENIPKAVTTLQEILVVFPDNTNALSYLAHAYIKLDHLSAAQPIINKAISLNPDNAYAWEVVAQLASTQTRHEDAVIAYQKVLLINSGRADIHQLIAQELRILKQDARALKHEEFARSLLNRQK